MKVYPKINILIPTYNRAATYLIGAILGALSQDYQNLEVIVLDDCSTDNTQEVLQNYSNDPRLKTIKNVKNLGTFKSIKKLVYEYNDSDWFMLLADDEHLTDVSFISKCVGLLNKYSDKNITLISANYETIFESNENKKLNSNRFLPEIIDGRSCFLNYYKSVIPAPFFIQKTDVAKKLGCWIGEFPSVNYEALLLLSLNGNVAFLKDTVGTYMIHDISFSYMLPKNMATNKVVKIAINDLCYIENLSKYAKENKIFPSKIIEKWYHKTMLKFSKVSFFVLIGANKKKEAILFKQKIKEKYPFISLRVFSIDMIIRYFLYKSKFLRKLVMLLRSIMDQLKLN